MRTQRTQRTQRTDLFSYVNRNFFNPLASNSSNDVNAGCLLVLYALYDHEVS